MTSINYEEELYHYGKLGMRLGIRRRMGRHDAYDNEVDRLYQRGTLNEKKLKRLVDIAYDG